MVGGTAEKKRCKKRFSMSCSLTCEIEPPMINEGFSDGTLVLEDGMSGGGGLVGLVVGRRTPSGILVITW